MIAAIFHAPQIYTESLLCSGAESNIQLAASHLTLSSSSPDPQTGITEPVSGMEAAEQGTLFRLSHDVSVQLVVAAAKEYFNSAASLMDSEMDLARFVYVRTLCDPFLIFQPPFPFQQSYT